MRTTYVSLTVLVGVSILMAACGSSGNQTLTPTAPSTTAAATTAPAATEAQAPAPQAPQTPAPAPYDLTFGCDASEHFAFVICVHDHVNPTDPASVFEVTKRVAWAFRGEGAGLLIKNDGENVVSWKGYNFSAGRICFPDGSLVKVIADVGSGGANSASWTDNGFVDPSRYVPAIDPAN